MNAIQFPNMIVSNKAAIVKDKDATYQNLKYLLLSMKKTLFGDPYFGSSLQKLLYENNNAILQDLVIDDIYTCITTFMPQISIERKNISVVSNLNTMYVHIVAQNLLDYSFDEYDINLINVEEVV